MRLLPADLHNDQNIYADETAYNRGVYEDETAYSREQAERQEAMSRLQAYLEAGGTLEGITGEGMEELVQRSGITQTELKALQEYYARQEAERQQELQAELYRTYNAGSGSSSKSGKSEDGISRDLSSLIVSLAQSDMNQNEALAIILENTNGSETFSNARKLFNNIRAEYLEQLAQDTGMEESNFTRAMSSIASLLNQGRVKDAEDAANQIYGRLNRDQQNRLLYMLQQRADVVRD